MPLIEKRYLTFISSSLAYFSNIFIVNLTFILGLQTVKDFFPHSLDLDKVNMLVIAVQALGILVGSIGFSMYIDKKGRLFILFISIFIYSFGTFVGGLVNNFYVFLGLKFIVGLALAPEIGIGLVLIAEMFNKYSRSLVIGFFALSGIAGIFSLSILSDFFEWRNLYIYGGICSMMVMTLRFASYESDLYINIKEINLKRLETLKLVLSKKFICLLLLALPIYTITAGTSWIGTSLIDKYNLTVLKADALLYFSFGMVSGIVIIPFISNLIKSRLKTIRILIFLMFIQTSVTTFYNWIPGNVEFLNAYFILLSYLSGFFISYMFELFTLFMESFGTNKRGGATTLYAGLARSSVFVFIGGFNLMASTFELDNFKSYFIVDSIVIMLAIWASTKVKESFNRDLNFLD